jgi:DNA-directed RNA polymerase specialized sigma24 family protein
VGSNEREQDLLKGLANNEKSAIEAIYRDNYSLIQNLIVQNNGTEDDARDVFQEAMIVLYEQARSSDFTLNCAVRT